MSAPAEKPVEILVLDDELDALDLLRMVLEHRGYTVHTCSMGEEALRMINEKPIAVVLVDLLMPDMSGTKFLSRMEALPDERRPVVLVISAMRRAEIEDRVRDLDVFRIIEKPFELRDIEAQVDLAAEEKRRRLHKTG